MGSKGNKRYVKALNTPGFIKIKRKDKKFFINANAGPHAKRFCLPLGHILRDLLKLTANARETRFILANGKVKVDGLVRKSGNFPVGLMDVVEIPEIKKAYRVLPSKAHGLILSEITAKEASFKLCRIENITTVKKGNLQLNLHDGRNILVTVKDASKKPDAVYKTRGTLKISIPDQKILDFYPMGETHQAIIYKGHNIGYAGKITKITERFGVNASIAEIGDISTAYDYAFIIGKDVPSIDLPME